MASKPTSEEKFLNASLIDGKEMVRISKRQTTGQKLWENWRIDFTGFLRFIGLNIITTKSVTGTGTATSPIQLVNDQANPGASKYYGTDAAGNKGWFTLTPGGGITTKVFITAADFTGSQLTNPAIIALLIGKNEATAFILQTNNGSGTTVDLNDGINSFNSVTGIIDVPADKYVLLVF